MAVASFGEEHWAHLYEVGPRVSGEVKREREEWRVRGELSRALDELPLISVALSPFFFLARFRMSRLRSRKGSMAVVVL